MNKKIVYGIGAAILGFLVYQKFKGGGFSAPSKEQKRAAIANPLQPAAIGRGELVTAATYQLTTQKRPGMYYVAAKLLPNRQVSFSSPQAGYFTRSVLRDGAGRLFAEVQAA